MSESGNRANNIVSFSAIFISLCALVVSVLQLQMADKQQRLGVLPIVTAGGSSGTKGFLLKINNGGVGPAIINCFRLRYREKAYTGWRPFLDSFQGSAETVNLASVAGVVLPAGETREILMVSPGTLADTLTKTLSNIHITICYSSLYEEMWCVEENFLPTTNMPSTPVRVEACTVPDAERFGNR
jgi:hypothetical protein